MNSIKQEDICRLRELGKKLREIADLPIQHHNKKLWFAINDLQMIRPTVHVRDYPLHLIRYQQELETTIEDEFLQKIESDLLLRLYEWNHLRCDRVVEPIVKCPVVYTDSGFGLAISSGVQKEFLEGGEYNRAVAYEPQIICQADLSKIQEPKVTYDEETTLRHRDLLEEIFSGILQVKLFGRCHFRCNAMDDVMTWTGIDNGMQNLILEPDLMHRAMELYIDAQISRIKQYEKLGILSSNNGFENVGNNCVGYTSSLPAPPESGIGAKIADIWGDNSDQIMTGASPAMSEEFAFNHEKKWAKMFGLHNYGCCERLDHKLNILRTSFPNLRKVSCSPFSNLEATMEQLGNKYVICYKPHSVHLAGGRANMDALRHEITHACALTEKYNVNLVFNMKTLITLGGEPQRLWDWCTMASQLVHDFYR